VSAHISRTAHSVCSPSPLWGGVGGGGPYLGRDLSITARPHPARCAREPPHKGEGRTESAARFCIQHKSKCRSTAGVKAWRQAACTAAIYLSQIRPMRLTRHLRPWANRLARLPRTRDNSSGSASVTDLGHKPQSQPKHQVEPPVSSEQVEGRPDRGASRPRKIKNPAEAGLEGGLPSAYSDHPGDGGVVGAAASP
jgi:hypothetical protein